METKEAAARIPAVLRVSVPESPADTFRQPRAAAYGGALSGMMWMSMLGASTVSRSTRFWRREKRPFLLFERPMTIFETPLTLAYSAICAGMSSP